MGRMTPGIDHSGEMGLDVHIRHFWVSAWKKQGFLVSLEMGFISLWGGASSVHLFCFLHLLPPVLKAGSSMFPIMHKFST